MGQDEVEVGAEKKDQELPEVEVVEEEEEEGSKKAAAGCDYCGDAAAVVYCRADAARLCLPCDRHVHGANGVCSRHARAPLCAACAAAGPSSAGRGRLLCSNCDFSRHRHGGERDPAAPLHDRSTVHPYTGCPSALDLAALLGISYSDKAAAATAAAGGDDGGWWAIWEEPQVLSLEDLIVPTTSCHGFEPLLTPSSPKVRFYSLLLFTVRKKKSPPFLNQLLFNLLPFIRLNSCLLQKIQNSPDGKVNEEVIRQLTELANSDGGGAQIWAHREAAQAGDHQLPSWGTTTQHNTGHGNFGTANSNEVATMPTPGYEV